MIVSPYDGSYSPAAIVLPVVIEATVSQRSAIMGMFIDVLAQQSIIALSVVDELGLTLFGESSVFDKAGRVVAAPVYFATIWIADRAYWTCAVGYGETSYVGRDILDQLRVTLDGPAAQLLVSPGEAR